MRMKRTHLGTAIGATAASVALGMTLAGPAGAVSPDEPAVCAGGAASFANNTPLDIPDTNTVVTPGDRGERGRGHAARR